MAEFKNIQPGPFGPYSTCAITDDFIYLAGQVPLTGEGEVIGEDLYTQTRAVLAQILQVLSSLKISPDRLVLLRVYTTRLEEADQINKAFTEVLTPPYPARELVGVAALPRGVYVEIAAIAENRR